MDQDKELNLTLVSYLNINKELGNLQSELNNLIMEEISKEEIEHLINIIDVLQKKINENTFLLLRKTKLKEPNLRGYLSVNHELDNLKNELNFLSINKLLKEQVKKQIYFISLMRKSIVENTQFLINRLDFDEEKANLCDSLLENILRENEAYNLEIDSKDDEYVSKI